jgi:hypothetical protein
MTGAAPRRLLAKPRDAGGDDESVGMPRQLLKPAGAILLVLHITHLAIVMVAGATAFPDREALIPSDVGLVNRGGDLAHASGPADKKFRS